MTSKLSFVYAGAGYERAIELMASAGLRVAKAQYFDSEQTIGELQRQLPGLLTVFRPRFRDNVVPLGEALAIVDGLRKLWGLGLYWSGINEPPFSNQAEAQFVNDWYVGWADGLHARGLKAAGPDWSTGNPIEKNLPLIQYCRSALEKLDIITLHEYLLSAGHYRLIWNALPVKKLIVITEAGYDVAGDPNNDGWAKHLSADEYLARLKHYDMMLLDDPYIAGATIFQIGDSGWPSFNLDNHRMLDRICSYVASVGGGAPINYTPTPPVVVLSDIELARLVEDWPDPVTAVAVILAESGGNPKARNDNGDSIDRGLWQINSKWHAEVSDAAAYDPVLSTRYALAISQQGTDFTPWSAFKAGAHLQYLDRARKAVESIKPMEPICEISASKTEVKPGETVTITYRAEYVQAAWLRVGTREIALAPAVGTYVDHPTQTTTYTLRAQTTAGPLDQSVTVKVVTAPETDYYVDPRIADRIQVVQGSDYHVRGVWYNGPDAIVYPKVPPGRSESRERINTKVVVLDASGLPSPGVLVVLDWADEADAWKTDAVGMVEFELYSQGYTVIVGGARVIGLGLYGNRHVQFNIQFQKAGA